MSRWVKYNLMVVTGWLLAVGVLLFVSQSMRGDGGELARLGGYRYDDFRSSSEIEVFSEPLYRLARSTEEYDRPYDVVVLGDSFSRNELFGWQNYLVVQTGASLITFDIQRTSFADIASSPVFQESPPVLFLYQLVERSLWLRHSTCDPESLPNGVRSTRVLELEPRWIERDLQSLDVPAAAGLSAAASVLSKTFLRRLVGLNVTRVSNLALGRTDLFSNPRSDELLVYRDDLHKRPLSSAELETISCSLSNIQYAAEKEGRTAFFTLIFPDKLTVYADALRDRSLADLSIIDDIPSLRDGRLISFDDVFREAVAAGMRDLYLPDDTHAGPAGYRLAADFLVARFEALGYLRSRQE